MSAPARASRLTRTRIRSARLFLAPMLLVLAGVAGWPLARTIWFGFTDAGLSELAAAEFIGFENYRYLLEDPDWWQAVRNTVVFTGVSVALETMLGLAIALALDARFRGRGLLRAAVLIPWAIPTMVSAKMWGWMYNDVFGVLNHMLLALGLIDAPVAWLASPDTALVAIILVDVWKATPFMALLLLAGLQMLPKECHESARVDGVHPLKVFFRVTLPLLKPALAVAVIFRVLDAMRVFDLIYVMSGNQRDTMSMSVYARQQLVDFQDVGYGSAAATLLFLIIALVTVVYLTLAKVGRDDAVEPSPPVRRRRQGAGDGGGRDMRAAGRLAPRPPLPDPGSSPTRRRLRRLAGRSAFYFLLALILLYTVFPFYWALVSSLKTGSALFAVEPWPAAPAWDNYVAVFREQPFGRNILNSIVVAVSAVLLSLALAVAAAWALARVHFRGRGLLLFVILGVSMFPQIAVLSGMFELIRALGLYNRLAALTLSYLIFTLPFTVWVLTTFMRELPRELEEAAIVDGAGPFTIVTRVFLPLMGPAFVTTGLLAFIAAWNEFLFALTFTLSSEMRTVPVAIALISGASVFELPWGHVMAASVIVTVPLIALVLVFQRRIVSGLTAGAVKG